MRRGAAARNILAAVALWAAAFSPLGAATLSLEQAQKVAIAAYQAGDFELANTLGRKLAEVRPEDWDALMLVAGTDPLMGRATEGRLAGRKAYRLAESRELKFQSAYVTARAALAEERYTSAQWWLRRAYHLADDESEQSQVARAFQQVRARSPWQFRVNFSYAPTSNVNGGTDAEYLVINDQITGGQIGAASRAIPGWRATASVDVSYRLRESARHQTTIGFYGLRTWNHLSEDVDGVDGSDFDYGVGEIELTHRMAGLPAPLPDRVSIAVGQVWSGLEPYERVGRLTLSRDIKFGDKTRLRVTGEAERRLSDLGRQDRNGTKLRFDLSRNLGHGIARASVMQTDVVSDFRDWEYTARTVQLSYAQLEGIAGFRLSGVLGWTRKVHPDHFAGFGEPRTEREDESMSGSVSLHMDRFGVMGFAPVVSYTADRTSSNINLYESRSYGWSLGLRSSF